MTALEEIKKALEGDMSTGLTAIDRLRFIVGGVPDFDQITVEDADWIIAALESLQRENEELRKALGNLEREASEVSKLGAVPGRQWTLMAGALINARTALASTGGEHNGN